MRSLDVAEWATGYTRWLAHLGYNQQSAHPWSLDDLQTVLAKLDDRIATSTGVTLLRLLRDAFTMTILWETCSRGATAVSWCLEDLWLPSGNPSLDLSSLAKLSPCSVREIASIHRSMASHTFTVPLVYQTDSTLPSSFALSFPRGTTAPICLCRETSCPLLVSCTANSARRVRLI